MFHWRTPAPTPAPQPTFHDILVKNTLAYQQGSAARIDQAALATYKIVKDALLDFSTKSLTTVFALNTVHGGATPLGLLAANERDHALVKVQNILIEEDKLECHIDGTCIKVIWRLPAEAAKTVPHPAATTLS
jgi:hypothetical protein